MNTSEAIAALTPKGRDAMQAIGRRKVSFFDQGIEEGSGSWSECLVADLGHRSSGVIVQLAELGLFDTSWHGKPDGTWYELTDLGAKVAKALAR